MGDRPRSRLTLVLRGFRLLDGDALLPVGGASPLLGRGVPAHRTATRDEHRQPGEGVHVRVRPGALRGRSLDGGEARSQARTYYPARSGGNRVHPWVETEIHPCADDDTAATRQAGGHDERRVHAATALHHDRPRRRPPARRLAAPATPAPAPHADRRHEPRPVAGRVHERAARHRQGLRDRRRHGRRARGCPRRRRRVRAAGRQGHRAPAGVRVRVAG